MPFVERRIRRILNARSVTFGLALTFVVLALIGGILIRVVDHGPACAPAWCKTATSAALASRRFDRGRVVGSVLGVRLAARPLPES